MKGKASDICTMCKHCEGSVDIVEKSYYICGVSHSDGGLYHLMPAEDELYCMSFEEVTMNKVEGKVSDWCPKCKNCKGATKESNGVHVWLTEVECEDPYDGMIKTLAADSNICCSMFEVKKEKEPFNLNMSREQLESKILDLFEEKNRLNSVINKLEKEKAAHLKGIERLKNKNDKYLKKIIDQQATHYKQCARILELECAVNKLQSGEYDDILAKDIEIKSLQAKYEDAMRGWNHTMESHDMLSQTVSEQKAKIEELTKMVERRDRWVKELQSDVYTLQNEILTIRNIAQKAYDDTNRD